MLARQQVAVAFHENEARSLPVKRRTRSQPTPAIRICRQKAMACTLGPDFDIATVTTMDTAARPDS